MAFAHVINPALGGSKFFTTTYILIVYWSITVINLFGAKTSSKVLKFGGFFGKILPVIIILAIGIISFFIKNHIPTDYSPSTWISHFSKENLVFLFQFL